jgi:hypothetical protein
MTAVSGAAAARCLQILQLATGTISSVLQTAVIAIKSTYQLVWPQPPKSLVGEVVLVCTELSLSDVMHYKQCHQYNKFV